jgi:anti-anti-sigma regulatory factor
MIAPTVTRPALRLSVGGRLDLPEALRIRAALLGAGRGDRVELDLSGTRALDGDAALLLESDLARLERAGARVALQRIPRRLHVQLHVHPILRFAREVDDLFTDPDLDWPGFRPSQR